MVEGGDALNGIGILQTMVSVGDISKEFFPL
jgi:hypothetical protein